MIDKSLIRIGDRVLVPTTKLDEGVMFPHTHLFGTFRGFNDIECEHPIIEFDDGRTEVLFSLQGLIHL